MTTYRYFRQAGNSVIEKQENGKPVGSYQAGRKAEGFLREHGIRTWEAQTCTIGEELVQHLLAKRWIFTCDLPAPTFVGIYNYKGGIGKTALVCGLGLALANQGKRVLLVDADPQSSLSITFLGHGKWVDVQKSGRSIWQLFEPIKDERDGELGARELVLAEQLSSQLFLIAGSPSVAEIELKLAMGAVNKSFQRRSAQVFFGIPDFAVTNEFDYVIFDAPPSFSFITVALLLVADHIIAPIDDDLSTFYGLWLFDHLRSRIIRTDPKKTFVNALEFDEPAVAKCRHALPSRFDNLEEVTSLWKDVKAIPDWETALAGIDLCDQGIPNDAEIARIFRSGNPFELLDSKKFAIFQASAQSLFPHAF